MSVRPKIGYACAYTPVALLHAAGFDPHRVLPIGEAPDQAGALLHDNLCPQVKRLLDRAMAGDLPPMAGMVFMNSCDAMRRLADAWRVARPADRLALIDLPTDSGPAARRYLGGELARLAQLLADWGGRAHLGQALLDSARLHDELARALAELDRRADPVTCQQERLRSVSQPFERSLERLGDLLRERAERSVSGVPIFLFGNVLPDPQALELFARCGAHIAGDDLCTGARQLTPLGLDDPSVALDQLAQALLDRPACARTMRCDAPLVLADELRERALACGARGVVAHVMKFCDPYLARLPGVRSALREADLPLLVLEGDGSLRSLGQQRTRLEAFVEMLGT